MLFFVTVVVVVVVALTAAGTGCADTIAGAAGVGVGLLDNVAKASPKEETDIGPGTGSGGRDEAAEAAAGACFVDNVMAGKFALDEKGSTTGGGKTIPDIALLFDLMLFGMFPLGFVVETGLPIDRGDGIEATA